MNTARITDLALAHDGAILVTAVCQTCDRTVLHGAGGNLDALVLGHRVSHCPCGDYTLTDPHGIVPTRTGVLRAEQAEQAARRARRAARIASR
jgi:hypothetical protein